VLIMDGDGEDDPRDVPRLIEHFHKNGGRTVVFARRTARSESLLFRVLYYAYRGLHRVLIGQSINVGNFSILPFEAVDRLVAVTELWNHYASAVFKARVPTDSIPTRRAHRLTGAPHMSLVTLVIHGLSSIAAYGDVLGVRLLFGSIAVMALVIGLMVVVGVLRLEHPNGTWPGWTLNVFALLLIILFQAFTNSVMFVFIILNNRLFANFLPVRDYNYFVLRTRRIV
jgi:hypothetical protein